MQFSWAHICGSLPASQLPILPAMLLAGLGGSVTHCLVMCSTFVFGQSPAGPSWLARLLVPYHLGRITTYSLLGGLSAAGVGLLPQTPVFVIVRHLALAVVAAVFLWTFADRIMTRAGLRLPFRLPALGGCAMSAWRELRGAQGPLHRFGLGLSLGLLPCPLVLAAIMAAATTASAPLGALAMFCFGIGTMPGLMALSFAKGNLLKTSPRVQDVLSIAALGINGVILLALAAG